MKKTIIGISVIILGIAMCITGISLCAVSAHNANSDNAAVNEEIKAIADVQDNKVYSGIYTADCGSGEKITITDSEIIFSDGSEESYRLSIWKNMPDTNEETGKITYSDYCFLKTSNNNFRYYPNTKEIDIDGKLYSLGSV